MKTLSRDPAQTRSSMIWVKALYDALEKFEPLRDHYDYIEKLLAAALWPTNVFVREAIVGAWECDFKQFSEKTTHDLENAARGFTVKPIEDMHRNCNVAARQNFNGKLSRQARWHVTQQCGVIENMDHKPCDPTVSDVRDSANESMSAKSFIPNAAKFSMGPEVYKKMLDTKDFHTYTPGHYFFAYIIFENQMKLLK